MSTSYSKTTYLVQLEANGKTTLVGPGQIPVGTILNGRKMLTIEGPGWDFAPSEPMTNEELSTWFEHMKSKGYRITRTQW